MSSFYAYDFIYDDIPSHKFALKIITFEDGGLFNGVGSSEVNIIEQRVLRKSKPYYLGRTQETKLEFPLTFGTYQPISGMERDRISAWLFGRSTYKKLYILQDDLNGAYFNCFLNTPEPLYIGGINYAFTCNVVCDSPWAYTAPRSFSGGSGKYGAMFTEEYFTIYNGSSEDEYLYPIIDFSIEDEGIPRDVLLTNYSDLDSDDNPRVFAFTNISFTGWFHVDSDLQIVSGRYGFGRQMFAPIRYFNKNWLRLLPGKNDFKIEISDSSLFNYNITWTERMKIGG